MEEIHTIEMDDGTKVTVRYDGDDGTVEVGPERVFVNAVGERLSVTEDYTALDDKYDMESYRVDTGTLYSSLSHFVANDDVTAVEIGTVRVEEDKTSKDDEAIIMNFDNGSNKRYTSADRLIDAATQVLFE